MWRSCHATKAYWCILHLWWSHACWRHLRWFAVCLYNSACAKILPKLHVPVFEPRHELTEPSSMKFLCYSLSACWSGTTKISAFSDCKQLCSGKCLVQYVGFYFLDCSKWSCVILFQEDCQVTGQVCLLASIFRVLEGVLTWSFPVGWPKMRWQHVSLSLHSVKGCERYPNLFSCLKLSFGGEGQGNPRHVSATSV